MNPVSTNEIRLKLQELSDSLNPFDKSVPDGIKKGLKEAIERITDDKGGAANLDESARRILLLMLPFSDDVCREKIFGIIYRVYGDTSNALSIFYRDAIYEISSLIWEDQSDATTAQLKNLIHSVAALDRESTRQQMVELLSTFDSGDEGDVYLQALETILKMKVDTRKSSYLT